MEKGDRFVLLSHFLWTIGTVISVGGFLLFIVYTNCNSLQTELNVYKSDIAKEISEIKQTTAVTATDVGWIKNKLGEAEIEK